MLVLYPDHTQTGKGLVTIERFLGGDESASFIMFTQDCTDSMNSCMQTRDNVSNGFTLTTALPFFLCAHAPLSSVWSPLRAKSALFNIYALKQLSGLLSPLEGAEVVNYKTLVWKCLFTCW